MFKVTCVNDSNRPNDIPNTKWINKGDEYTVVQVDYLNIQNRVLGFKLAEVDLTDCFPYQYFLASRFAPLSMLDEEAEEAVKSLLEEKYVGV